MTCSFKRLICICALAGLLPGCDEPAGPGKKLRAEIDGARIELLLLDCKVYLTAHSKERIRERVRVLEPEPYPWFTFCDRQDLSADKRYIKATLGRVAFGAGGCCATGGTYRSRDGRNWEKHVTDDKWQRVERDSVEKPPAK
jgi:hypothetical protein